MASGFTDLTNTDLIRTQLWSRDLKSLLLDELYAMRFVRPITEFPDGELINIPSIGEAEVSDFAEGNAIKYNKMDTGNFQFQWKDYKYSANAVSEKFKQDSYYASDVIAAFVPRQHRALMEAVEVDILKEGNEGQTASQLNTINGQPHRWVAQGTGNVLVAKDFSQARLSLFKANVPLNNLVCLLDATSAFHMETQTNLVNLMSPQPMWEDVLKNGMVNGTKFRYNIMGFDCYVTNYLPTISSETVDGTTVTNGVANQFFSAVSSDVAPYIGGFKQTPQVYSEFNKDLMQTEYLTIARYGFALFRPENMINVLSSTAV
jgi:hypothetical protein